MRILGHVDDVRLPIDAVNGALCDDRIDLTLISETADIACLTEIASERTSALFILTPGFYDEIRATSAFDIDVAAQRVMCALILARPEFPNAWSSRAPGFAWIFDDLGPAGLRASVLLAIRGICLVSDEHYSGTGVAAVDRTRLESLHMIDCAILMHLARGLSDSGIAGELGISNLQVRQRIADICDTLALSSRAEAGAFYLRYRDRVVAHRQRLLANWSGRS